MKKLQKKYEHWNSNPDMRSKTFVLLSALDLKIEPYEKSAKFGTRNRIYHTGSLDPAHWTTATTDSSKSKFQVHDNCSIKNTKRTVRPTHWKIFLPFKSRWKLIIFNIFSNGLGGIDRKFVCCLGNISHVQNDILGIKWNLMSIDFTFFCLFALRRRLPDWPTGRYWSIKWTG